MSSTEAAPTAQSVSPTANYRPPPGLFDEMHDPSGAVRPVWRRMAAAFDELKLDGLQRQADHARRLLRENGVTYGVYGEEREHERPWELDCVPMVMSSGEWITLGEGLTQRATLLNLILLDLYGRQDLLKQGLLPAELVLGHPGFLLPCHGIAVPNDCYLHLYAAHLGRAPDGRWLALADRTQGPSGTGYALENRMIVNRVAADHFHEARVRRLASFFKTLRDTLFASAVRHRENPRVVLLSPGPASSGYFEDVYLARYLGYTLVEGGDLTVRDNAVFMKTLGGLLPVDVVLRRLLDSDCDPLELRSERMLGVPGLLQAARSGNVVVANALGSGMLEAPALAAFLPELCRRMLGEELKLPSVPTWWCGDADDLKFTLDNLSRLIIRPALMHRSRPPIFGETLSSTELAALAAEIRARPRDFAAQEPIPRSTTPSWRNGELQPRHVALRTFVAASGDHYDVMPGGLIRVSDEPLALGVSMSAGQTSKDLWVLTDAPLKPVTLLQPAGASIELRRSGNDLPSRVADNMFWLGRQAERAEGMIRRTRSLIARILSDSESGTIPELNVLADVVASSWRGEGPEADSAAERRRAVLRSLYDVERGDSLSSMLRAVNRLASVVRDRLSLDSWRILSQLHRELEGDALPDDDDLDEVLRRLNQVLMLLSAFSGLVSESMTRGPGWRFLDIGRRIERAQHATRLLHDLLVRNTVETAPIIETLLEIGDSAMTYRARYLTTVQLAPALDLMLTDESNPRSVAFQLAVLTDHVQQLPHDEAKARQTPEHRIMLAVQTDLRLTDVESLCSVERDGRRSALDDLFERLETRLTSLSEAISHTYLVHAGPSRQLGRITPSART